MKKRVFALLLCFAMVLPLVACTPDTPDVTAPSIRPPEELDWLNISTEAFDLPIVKEGTEKTLTIWYRTAGGMEDPEQTWTYKFAVEHMNINLEVRPLYSSNQSEVLSTAFATGDLPDIIVGSKFTTADMVKYGVLEEQLLDLAPYIKAGYMPNLASLMEMTPAYGDVITDGDGHIWSAPYIGVATTAAAISRALLNYDWLEEAGISSVPKTADEFLAAMRAMKAKDPNRYPVGGSWSTYNPVQYFLNAFGFVGEGKITDISLYNGKVTLPAANREAYGEFLKYMNTLYTTASFFLTGSPTKRIKPMNIADATLNHERIALNQSVVSILKDCLNKHKVKKNVTPIVASENNTNITIHFAFFIKSFPLSYHICKNAHKTCNFANN